MRLLQKSKRIISAGLSVIMLSSMMAGLTGKEVYAATPAGPGNLMFDVANGPDLSFSTNYDTGFPIAKNGNNQYLVSGSAGARLIDTAPFNNASVWTGNKIDNHGVGPRPAMPKYDNTRDSATWKGFHFDGWFDENDEEYDHLPYAFQTDGTYLKAKWSTSTETGKHFFRVRHYFVKSGTVTKGNNVLNHDDSRIIPFKYDSWASDKLVTANQKDNEQISATPARDIPGYKVKAYANGGSGISASKYRNWDDSADFGTNDLARLDTTTQKVSGIMPNRDLTVDYEYEVDTAKKFTVRIQYVNANDGSLLKPDDDTTYQFNAGAQVTGTLPEKPANDPLSLYVLQTDSVTDMVDIAGLRPNALATSGVYSIQYINGKAEGADMRTSEFFNTTNKSFSFKMPNHNIIIRAKYNVDTSVTRPVAVSFVDNHNVAMPALTSTATSESGSKQVPTQYELVLPVQEGYVYPPNVDLGPSTTDFARQDIVSTGVVKPDGTVEKKLVYKVTTSEPAGGRTIKVNYIEKTSVTSFWTKVNFEQEGVAATGFTLPGQRALKKDPKNAANVSINNTLADVLGTAGTPATSLPPAGQDYLFDCVYWKGHPDTKYTELTDVVNLKAQADGGIANDGTGNATLVIKFKKDPAKWAKVQFRAGSGGVISGTRVFPSKNINDTVASFAPVIGTNVNPKPNYQFDGWYLADEHGNATTRVTTYDPAHGLTGAFDPTRKVSDSDVAENTVFTYVAVFKGIDPRPGVYIAPSLDAGNDENNGTGAITVSGLSDRRRYILTDVAGNILDNKAGTALSGGKFAPLAIGRKYKVYEVEATDTTSTGNISAVNPKSDPAEVIVPVAATSKIQSQSDKVTLSSPVANTEYALVNSATGEVKANPTLDNGKLVFAGLTANTNYVLVARPSGDTTSFTDPSILESGTPTYTTSGIAVAATYKITVTGSGAKIESITRNGTPLGAADGFTPGSTSYDRLQKKDRVRITADNEVTHPNRWKFNNWELNLGGPVTGITSAGREYGFDMPSSDVIINAVHKYDSSVAGATAPSIDEYNSSLTFSPMNGRFSIDPAQINAYKNTIVNSTSTDHDYINDPPAVISGRESSRKVNYVVKFNTRNILASESNAIRALSSDPDLIRFAFTVDVSFTRRFNSTIVALDGSSNIPAMNVYAKLDPSSRGGFDYKLYRVAAGTVTEVSPPGLSDLADETFMMTGVNPNAGETYILAYKKKNTVKIIDTKSYLPVTDPARTTEHTVEVPEGSALEDVATYTAIGFDTNAIIDTAPTDGRKFKLLGLYKNQVYDENNQNNNHEFSPTTTVTDSITLYTHYQRHETRTDEIRALRDKIAEIDALLNNPNISTAARGQLTAAKVAARSAIDKVGPISTAAELTAMKDTTVQAAIDAANDSLTIGNSRTELNNSIGLSNTLLADTTKPVSADDKQAIEDLRDRASLLLTDPSATQAQIDAMRQQLNDLIDQAEARADKVVELNTVINELRGLAPNSKLNNADRDTINQAIAAAESLRDKTSNPADPSQVQATIAELLAKKAELEQLVRDARAKINNSGSGGSGGGSSSGGGGGGGSSSGGGGPKAKNATVAGINYKTYRNETEGDWRQNSNGSWNFVLKNSAEPLKSSWAAIVYGSGEGQSLATYAFDAQGNMRTGWIQDDKGLWYYMSDAQGSSYGAMVKGWIFSAGKWYYLSPVTGSMMTGWQEVEGKWYLLAGDGSLYVNTTTPDGFPVDANGVWLRETP